jgi:hypothetical protein
MHAHARARAHAHTRSRSTVTHAHVLRLHRRHARVHVEVPLQAAHPARKACAVQPPTTPLPYGPSRRRPTPLRLASPRPSHSAGQLGPDAAARQACLHERLERVTLKVAGAADARLVVAEVGHLADCVCVAAEPSATQRLGVPTSRHASVVTGSGLRSPRARRRAATAAFLRPHMALACTGACGSAQRRCAQRGSCAERAL